MKCKTTLFGLSLVLVAGLMWMPGSAAEGQGRSMLQNGKSTFGFGQRIAGTYFSNAGFGGTLTLHADGTVVALSGACCGDNAGNIQSESYGNWVRTGTRQITLRTVAIGTNFDWGVGPIGNFIATPMEVLDFAPDFQSYTGNLCTSVWFYDLGGGNMPDVEVDPPLLTIDFGPVASSRLAVFIECE
ncbi:MAG: hypothetical protein ACYTEI_02565 [Planctomycetota bacterium]|jgi:hypothetical protein